VKPFDPSDVALDNGQFFGFPYSWEDSHVCILGVPWDLTTSYKAGTRKGPEAILKASRQLDFTSPLHESPWEIPIHTLQQPDHWLPWGETLRSHAEKCMRLYEEGRSPPPQLLADVNGADSTFHEEVFSLCRKQIEAGKKLLVVGGDHSVSYGPIKALAPLPLSVLHIDAHADLRVNYEGFHHSHASIMDRVKNFSHVEKIVQVGLRDVSPSEKLVINSSPKIRSFFDFEVQKRKHEGISLQAQIRDWIAPLGTNVYISFDVDGLDPKLCPNTGTPVPGGLSWSEVQLLFWELKESRRTIVGADLVEVAPGPGGEDWDANVGARLAFQLAILLGQSTIRSTPP
jgi:agmatinase